MPIYMIGGHAKYDMKKSINKDMYEKSINKDMFYCIP